MKRDIVLNAFLFLIVGTFFNLQAGEIHDAVKAGNAEKIKELLGEKPERAIDKDESGNLPIHYARTEVIVDLLLAYKINEQINALGKDDYTPFARAMSARRYNIAKHLIRCGAEITGPISGRPDPISGRLGYALNIFHFIAKCDNKNAEQNVEMAKFVAETIAARQNGNDTLAELLLQPSSAFMLSPTQMANKSGAVKVELCFIAVLNSIVKEKCGDKALLNLLENEKPGTKQYNAKIRQMLKTASASQVTSSLSSSSSSILPSSSSAADEKKA